jgi:phosphohistidine phosphatase
MEVLFVRHAVAAELADTDGLDFQRPLTEKGRKQFRALAQWLVEQGQAPDLIESSPLVRAVQTAEILRKASGLDAGNSRVDESLGPGLTADWLVAHWKDSPVSRVAIVGHEPDLSRCIAALMGGGQLKLAKGGVACLEFDKTPKIAEGELKWFVIPKLLKG